MKRRTLRPDRRELLLGSLSLVAAACTGSGDSPAPIGGGGTPRPGGETVSVKLSLEQQREVDRLTALVAETKGLSPDEILRRRAVPFRAALGYDPTKAVNLELLQASSLKLTGAEMETLGRHGFVISDKRRYPHFAYGYKAIYADDLPVFISADAILQAVHQSYEKILKTLEQDSLAPELDALLTKMRGELPGVRGVEAEARADADLFLAVALGLLRGKAVRPVAGASATEIDSYVTKAVEANRSAPATLFGARREIDFSQFKPRGHYAGAPELERYFRAMVWLGRIDFPFLQTDPDNGEQKLVRRCVAAALALRAAMNAGVRATWGRLDATIRAFVGEPDSMAPPEVDRLMADLKLSGPSLTGISDEALANAIVAGAYGKQKILSQIVIQAHHEGTWPLDAVFLFFGQRYVFDAHVLSNVVDDRVEDRMMPSTFDVAYAALGNDQAAQLLEPELRRYEEYPPALEAIRRLGDEHGERFWEANLYNLWLAALRALSPTEVADEKSGLPAVARTEAWGRRMLNTQLASWAQLRHETILYAKQSYTTGYLCEFPDAYVDPYPRFFAAIERFAAKGAATVEKLPLAKDSTLGKRVETYFTKLRAVAGILRDMAERQRSGLPHTEQQLAFVNQAIDVHGCYGPGRISGWYADLFFEPAEAAAFNPTIVDVHTQPTDKLGNDVGHVLHVGTGWARLAVITVDTCKGPRAYAGIVSSYHEVVTEKLQRLTDREWSGRFTAAATPDDVPWMKDLIVK